MAYNSHKTIGQSKKATIAILTMVVGLIVYGSSVGLVCIFPVSASYIVTVANLMFVLIGSVGGAMITGQSFVEWKSANNVETTNTHSDSYVQEKKEDITENINLTGVYAPVQVRPKHIDNGNIE